MPLDALRRVIEVNLIGSFNIMRLSAAEMSNLEPFDEGERGIIVSTASAAAYEGQIGTGRLQRLKAWHRLLELAGRARARALRNPRAGHRSGHIRDADAAGPAAEHPRQPRRKRSVPEPAGRPEEYAALVLHLCRNAMINGELVRLDGGLGMAPR
jgi:NAD(P)-dependent dehydrogenase (short-subunit alcohol dehydrogenase family)